MPSLSVGVRTVFFCLVFHVVVEVTQSCWAESVIFIEDGENSSKRRLYETQN
jgi:hypothetical protein